MNEGPGRASTAEALMRSRYTAFTLADVDYIEKTTDPSSRSNFDREGTTEWAKNSEWIGLEIANTSGGQKGDADGIVEFVAKYRYDGVERAHHERAEFTFRDGRWYFLDGKLVHAPVRNENKIGRNDPCTCGSGKKYKKCCGS
jgi:SEC-C motif-containing protein